MRCFSFILILCLILTACSNHTPKTECIELDCTIPTTTSYCKMHTAVYAHEREFYPLVRHLIDAISATPGYATNNTFHIEDVYVHYIQPTENTAFYTLELYAHYRYLNEDYYVYYNEGAKQSGNQSTLTPCSQAEYASIQKAAHGGLNTHQNKERSKHYSMPATDKYIYNEYFSINPDDFKKYPYS